MIQAPVFQFAVINEFLQVPETGIFHGKHENFKERLQELFSSVVDPQKAAGMSHREIVETFTKYFTDLDTFQYTLNSKLAAEMDPVFAFVENTEGHCELFATTSVMLLRSYGIPARYVTGFFCSEQHPSERYYVGRSNDLHAWVEYYDKDSAKWRIMEPTPPGYMPDGKSEFGSFASLWDSITQRWDELVASAVKGYFAETIILVLQYLVEILAWFFNTPLKAFVSVILMAFIYFKRRQKKAKIHLPEEFIAIAADFAKLHKKILTIKNLSIQPSMTLAEISTILEKKNTPEANIYSDCLKDYQLMRYCEHQRSETGLLQLRKKIKAALKTRVR